MSPQKKLINYFKDYPKCENMAKEIGDKLGDALTDELVILITNLSDTFTYETKK